jgi:hypothetical protein
MKQWTGGNKTKQSKVVIKDKFSKLEDRISLRGCKKLLYDFVINTRSTTLRICLIQSLISAWFEL